MMSYFISLKFSISKANRYLRVPKYLYNIFMLTEILHYTEEQFGFQVVHSFGNIEKCDTHTHYHDR